jgi:hypothetical protein
MISPMSGISIKNVELSYDNLIIQLIALLVPIVASGRNPQDISMLVSLTVTLPLPLLIGNRS